MLFYWIIFFIILIAAFKSSIRRRKKSYIFIILLLGFLGATRAMSVGMDVTGYCMTYDAVNWRNYEFFLDRTEPGFLTCMLLMKDFGISNPMFFVYACFIVFFSLNIDFINKYSIAPAFALFLIYAMGYYFGAFNTVRQMLCHALILPFIPWLFKKKFIVFSLIVIIFSILFHKSQVLMLLCIVPFVLSEKLQEKKFLYCALIGSVLLGAFVMPKISALLTLLSLYLSNDTYVGYLSDTTTIGDLSVFNLGIHSLYISAVVYFYNDSIHTVASRKFLVISIIGQVLSNLVSPISWILARVTDSLCYFRIIPISEIFFSSNASKKVVYFRIITILYFLVRFYGRLIRDGVGDDGDVIPYVNALIGISF